MKRIEFKEEAAERIYSDYLRRSERSLKRLSEKDRNEILMEINSHIFEYLQDHSKEDELSALLNVIERLGAPEETLREQIASRKIDQAIQTYNLKHLLQALVLNIGNGIIYILLSILTLITACFPILVLLKLIFPAKTGYFRGPDYNNFGYISDADKSHELLGNWFIPIMIILGAFFYFLVFLLLKLVRTKK
jgi:uncharacterized membrane protein